MKVMYKGEELGYIITERNMKPKDALIEIGYEMMDIVEMDMRDVHLCYHDPDVWQDIDDGEPLNL